MNYQENTGRAMPEWVPESVIQFLAPNESRPIWRSLFHWAFFILSYSLYLRITYQFRGRKLFWNMVFVILIISVFLFFPAYIPSPKTSFQFIFYWALYLVLYVYLVWEVVRHQTIGYKKPKDWFYWFILFFLGSSILLASFEIIYHIKTIISLQNQEKKQTSL